MTQSQKKYGRYDLKPPIILVSSSVYGHESLLDQIYAVLCGYGYTVWMSHKGTLPVDPKLTAFESCLAAVDKADAFLGIINGRYGSGVNSDDLSITHQEMLRAIEKEKTRFFVAHRDVGIAKQLLRQFRKDENGQCRHYKFFKPTAILDDIRILDLYDAATRTDVDLPERKGNWVQNYGNASELLLFIESQFSDIERFKLMIAQCEK